VTWSAPWALDRGRSDGKGTGGKGVGGKGVVGGGEVGRLEARGLRNLFGDGTETLSQTKGSTSSEPRL
jgi:hypothetical protein